jgi:DNA-binding LytR/AlgR family response regulator
MRVAFTNALAITSSTATRSPAPALLKVIRLERFHAITGQKICLPCSEGTYVVGWKDIVHCEAVNNYCRIHLMNGKIIFIAKTLKNIEALLPKDVFIRIHRSHLIRLDLVALTTPNTIELVNGTVLPLAKNRHTEILNQIKNCCHI